MIWRRRHLVLLAVVAYLPVLASSPGRMPGDTKLYLTLDPGRLLSDAAWSWDGRQFAGWVPHQIIGYLWPSGPWFWVFDQIGVPDWIAHRLWIGTILFAAGAGVWWCARRLGLGPAGALAAALVYQLSPYLLPYVSRTSVLLLPWAGLGWLVGLTVGAVRRGGWRDPALFALVVATVGGINATALLMVAPAPLLVLLDAGLRREVPWSRVAATTARIGGLSLAVSLWWLVFLSVQSRYGADVLAYSETLESVSFTAQANEVVRGLGYWLFYVRDPVAFATTASQPYQEVALLQLVGWVLVAVGVAGIVLAAWVRRRFAAWAVLVGTVLAVGVHPIDDPSPLAQPLASSARSDLVLALRSSTRAVPLVVLGLALGAGALVAAIGARWPRRAPWAVAAVGLLAAANLPVLWTAGFVDEAIDRPEDVPEAWRDAAALLDQGTGRVLQLPGQEFGAHQWGYLVDPLLPGITDRPLVTRDLLPLGSAPAMDLLYALDDRFQEGVPEYAAVAPVARLLGATTVVFAGDAAFDRFGTPRPEPVWDELRAGVPGLGEPVTFGEPATAATSVPMLDARALGDPRTGTAVPPVAVVPVAEPAGLVRAGRTGVILAGDGAGVVDAAAAGLLDGDEVLVYAAAHPDDLDEVLARSPGAGVILTDTFRKQAHQWRGSQDVLGAVEPAAHGVLSQDDPADHRLPVFPDAGPDEQTVVVLDGPVRAEASGYGEAVAYRPEDRPALAVDGDPTTAWRVGDRAAVHGESITLHLDEVMTVPSLRLVQPLDPSDVRWITQVAVRGGGVERVVDLDERSRTADGQVLPVDLPPTDEVTIEVQATNTGVAPLYLDRNGVGFAEIDLGLGPTEEVLRLPRIGGADEPGRPLSIVLTRWRTDPRDRWRDDPEPALVRSFTLGTERDFAPEVTVRLDPRAPDAVLAPLLGVDGATSGARLTGTPAAAGWAALDGDPATAWTTPFGSPADWWLDVPLDPGTTLDTVTLHLVDDEDHARPAEVEIAVGDQVHVVAVPPPDEEGRVELRFPAATGDRLRLTITGTDGSTTRDRRYGELVGLPVAVAEIDAAGASRVALPATLDTGCREDLVSVDGQPLAVRVQGDVTDLLDGEPATVTPCDGAIRLAAGDHEVRSAPGASTGLQVDRVVLRGGAPATAAPAPAATLVDQGRTRRTVEVGPCPDGCWVVLADGYNRGWSARTGGEDLGPPQMVDGGMNGWWLPPSDATRTVEVSWPPQRAVWWGLGASLVAVSACVVLAVRGRRRRLPADPSPTIARIGARHPRDVAVPLGVGVVGALVVGPWWGLGALGIALVTHVLLRRPGFLGVAALGAMAVVGAGVVGRTLQVSPDAGFGWVTWYEEAHRPALLAVVLLAGAAARPRSADAASLGSPGA